MYLIKDSNILFNVEEFSIGFEIFNMFNIQNTITNTWVRDVYSKDNTVSQIILVQEYLI